ncbi:ATP-binding protein [Aliarcobacter butzleri]|uniref:ATP-binding protein n=1 Tax=Aliarcobacter butzleri TaxID=28197 RepID=UPI001EDB6EA7|nr:ATP-binding protein [Aliarcobacter butzleri]MCG3692091.1 AAA family ATPase [Aliarcobacter butzleri]
MKTLKITNFKAHQDLIEIKLDEKNFLLYGDNGAGKSSIYEVLKVIFYRDRLETIIKKQSTPENQEEKIREFYSEYNNKITNRDFEIKINNFNYKDFPTSDYKVYMLNLEDTIFSKTIKLKDLYDNVFFNFPKSICFAYKEIEIKANNFLEYCLEDIKIEIDSLDDYSIKIKNDKRSITNTKEIKRYFNEGKINLVIFALLFSAIEVSKDDMKKNILILDDFITSLDMANRTFLMRYIFDTFKNFQILIFTHNVYFYNLIMYLINDKVCETSKEWQFANLYEIGNEQKIYINSDFIAIDSIEKEYDNEVKKISPNFQNIGNKLRQKFERLLYELSKIMMIGGVEESNKILETILENQNTYILKYEDMSGSKKKIRYKNGNDLSIEVNSLSTLTDIRNKIKEYELNNFDEIKVILKTLKLYRKVTMHSLSHGQTGQHNWSNKEIKQTLILLKKLETNIKDITNSTTN